MPENYSINGMPEMTGTVLEDERKLPSQLQLYVSGLRTHDIEKIGASFSDAIQFITPAKTMGREEILEFLTALYRGFPDWSYDNDPPILCDDGRFGVKWRQGGTHTETLEFPGFDAYPATGCSVAIPEHFFFYRKDEQGLCEIHPDPVPGGAPRGIFEQIGVALPPL